MFSISNLSLTINQKPILENINLDLRSGQDLFIVGPNGSGKSSLLKSIIGLLPEDSKLTGEIVYQGQVLNSLSIEQRFQKGIFLAWQTPPELTGVSVANFFKAILKGWKTTEILDKLIQALELVGLDSNYLSREVDRGLSGGERKRLELVQIILLQPQLVLLDELDSGLDVDGLKILSRIRNLPEFQKTSWVVVSHRLELIQDFEKAKVIQLQAGKITQTGGLELGLKLIQDQTFEA